MNSTPAAIPARWWQFVKPLNYMRLIAFIFLLLCSSLTRAQSIDSLLAEPQTLELTISTPQPRIGETFYLSINVGHLKANIFKSVIGKLKFANDITSSENREMLINVNAIEKGKHEIGPLDFVLNNTKYTTNKISYEVVEALPNTDKGIWFRKVNTSDTTFCIILEQRIPSSSKTIFKTNNVTVRSEPVTEQIAELKSSYSIIGLRGGNSSSSTKFGSVEDKKGLEKEFMYGYSIYYFEIVDKSEKIVITKDKFENLPKDYKFQDILIK